MILSLALVIFGGLLLGGVMQKIKLPGFIGMLLCGVALGPYALDWLAPELLNISADIREIALVIILARAGLALDFRALKKVGRPAVLMCFVPATFEMAATTLLAPVFFPVSYLEAAIMGAVVAAVSPAVIVPKMLKLIENGRGKAHSVPQLIMAGASVDDIYVIVFFSALMGMYGEGGFDGTSFAKIPLAIVTGLLAGVLLGLAVAAVFQKIRMRDTVKVLVLLSAAFLLVSVEKMVRVYLPVSGLLAVMALGGTILMRNRPVAGRLSGKLSKLWVGAELVSFVLVGAMVDVRYAAQAGAAAVLLIMAALLLRSIGVLVSLFHSPLTVRERLFCVVSYWPKATVQATIGGLPLAAGVAAGHTVLTVSVLAILIAAPLGAIGIDAVEKWVFEKQMDSKIDYKNK